MGSECSLVTEIDRAVKIYATCLPVPIELVSFHCYRLHSISASEYNSLCTLDLRSKLMTCSDTISC